MLAHAQIMFNSSGASSSCFGPTKSAVAGFSLTSLLFSSWRCCLHLMQSPSDWSQLAGQLLWAAFLPHFTSLFVPAPYAGMSKYWRRQNVGASQDFTNFRQTSAVNISAHRRPVKKWWKQKAITMTVRNQFFYSWPPSGGCHEDPPPTQKIVG